MYRPRIIPVLLFRNGGLVKSVKFKNNRYIGDPINAVRIFNDLKADELVFIDTKATNEKRLIPLDFVKSVGEEANMPFSVGGGIRTVNDIRQILELGAERVILNTIVSENPNFVEKAVKEFGSSTISVCLDVKRSLWGKQTAMIYSGRKTIKQSPLDFASDIESMGVGEIILQSIDRDGTMSGYDIDLIKQFSERLTIPIVALGGAGKLSDFKSLNERTTINGFAAGSMFVFHGRRKGILVNYPTKEEIKTLFDESM